LIGQLIANKRAAWPKNAYRIPAECSD
jgi:hypothetical protein